MPRVWNINDPKCPKDAVYIGRPGKGILLSMFGNQHLIGWCKLCRIKHDRAGAIKAFVEDLTPEDKHRIKHYLKGKDVKCFCHPLPCHGDPIIEIANS